VEQAKGVVNQISSQMEVAEDSTHLKPQYHKAQQVYIQTQGNAHITIGLLQQYKGKVEYVEQQVQTQAKIYKEHLKQIQDEFAKPESNGTSIASIAETHLQSVAQMTKEWSQLQMELSLAFPDAVQPTPQLCKNKGRINRSVDHRTAPIFTNFISGRDKALGVGECWTRFRRKSEPTPTRCVTDILSHRQEGSPTRQLTDGCRNRRARIHQWMLDPMGESQPTPSDEAVIDMSRSPDSCWPKMHKH